MSRINSKKRACLHKCGRPQVGEVIRIGGVTCLSIWSLIFIWSRLLNRWSDRRRDYMDMRVTPPKRGTSPTCNPRHTYLGHPLLYPYFWKKVVLLPPPVLIFFASDMKTRRNQNWGGRKYPTVLTNVTKWRVLQFRHIKLGHPVLYPYSDKKLCSFSPLPPLCFFYFWHASTTKATNLTLITLIQLIIVKHYKTL